MSGRWSWPRPLVVALAVLLNISFGIGVYLFLGASRPSFNLQRGNPTQAGRSEGPISRLPGTLYLVQGGALYRLEKGRFTTVLSAGGWTQPALTASGQELLVVKRERWFSDLYLVDARGQVRGQLTRNVGSNLFPVDSNHWLFYPRAAPDGSSVFFAWDNPKDRFNPYNVVLSIWQVPLPGGSGQVRRWTTPNDHTGGDVQPVPLASGGLIYTKFAYVEDVVRSQLWLTVRPGTPGKALTPPEVDCAQPALSPDGRRLAMVCTSDKQVASLEVAAFDGASLGPRQVIVSGAQGAQPTWAPDGSGLVYLAPSGLAGLFQLWWAALPRAGPSPEPTAPEAGQASPAPSPSPTPAPEQLTQGLDFDATSTIAWR